MVIYAYALVYEALNSAQLYQFLWAQHFQMYSDEARF